MNEHNHFDIERELRRIGVDTHLLGGLASSGRTSGDDFLAWLRRLPTGLGHAAFINELATDGPRPGSAADGVPPRDLSFETPDIDLMQSLMTEFRRVLPDDMIDHSWAIIEWGDKAAAVAKLKAMPDRAGWEAVSAVLPLVKVVNESET